MAATLNAAQQQDQLRSVRNFLSLLSGATQDQTYAEQDAYAVRATGSFSTVGPNGVAVEGQPVIVGSSTQSGQRLIVPPVLIVGALALAYAVLK